MGSEVSVRSRGVMVAAVMVAIASPAIARSAPATGTGTGSKPVPEYVAPALRPWIPWVMHGHEVETCPLLAAGSRQQPQRVCFWPGLLELSLEGKGGRFAQRVKAWAEQAVALPGEEKRWPQEVTVDGKPAAVVALGNRPSVRLHSGEHLIRGTFRWDSLPEALPVPSQIGLLDLSVRGERVAYPTRDEEGVVWLEKRADQDDAERALDVVVHRKVVDDVPLLLVTRVELRVAGKNREELLGRALPQDFVPMSLSSPLPARLEPDGRLRVQVRPGDFVVELTARHQGPVQTLSLPPADGPWAGEEAWAFEAQPRLRRVVVEGVVALDPNQTTLPADWKKLPVYRLRPGETMALTEKQRGDADPAPDRLAISRTLWLDMDGRGFSFQDQLTGTLSRSWRLDMPSPSELGYVSVSGQDVLITRLKADGPPGVETSQGQLQLLAEGRIEGRRSTIPAVGWSSDFQSASATLQLPPGWRLLAARGADDVPGTWLRSWDLLDLFLLLITALATVRLFGWRMGLLALVTLALIIPEPDAPRWIWLVVLACEALVRLLPEGRWRQMLRIVRLGATAGLVLFAVLFAIHQVRVGMHPVLERPYQSPNEIAPIGLPGMANAMKMPAPSPPASQTTATAEIAAESEEAPSDDVSLGYARGRGSIAKGAVSKPQQQRSLLNQYRYQYDSKAAVQTGKGLPRWSWKSIPIRWSGPVTHDQRLTLLLIPPSVNLLLALVRVLLTALWLVVLCALPGRFWTGGLRRFFSGASTAALLMILWTAVAPAAYAQDTEDQDSEEEVDSTQASEPDTAPPGIAPPNSLLGELRSRLLAPPKCYPGCASIARMSLETTPGWLRIRLEVHAQAESGVPLPGDWRSFGPRQVLVGGQPAVLRRGQDGVLWALVPAGTQTVLMEGPLPGSEIITLTLPLRPHHVEARTQGYLVAGIQEDGVAEDSLQLTRLERGKGATAALAPSQLPPFVRVERTLSLGLDWQVNTRVIRLTPLGTAVVVEVPLLAGEQVNTPSVRVEGGKVLVHLAPRATEMEWRSALEIRETLQLKAESPAFVESWQLDASPIWHITWSGIPTIHPLDPNGRVPEWRPWPGESVDLTVVRPEAVPGPTLTVNQSQLLVKPGIRSTESTLTLVVRSSRGGQHSLRLPAGAEVQSVVVQGQVQPIRLEGGELSLPVVPGEQQFQITWRQPQGIATLFRAAAVDLGTSSVNADLRIEVPRQRWVLWAGGAPMGPAVLFWNLLVVLLLVAIGLSRLGWAPLRWWSWMLLVVGLTQVPIAAAAVPVAWLLLLEWRRRSTITSRLWFNLSQIALVGVTLLALGVLVFSIERGLLGLPDMQVQGNSSSARLLRWFADRCGPILPRPWFLSLPLLVYRGLMLVWALWIAWSLLSWLQWGWTCFTTGGGWRPKPRKPQGPPEPLATVSAEPRQ